MLSSFDVSRSQEKEFHHKRIPVSFILHLRMLIWLITPELY